jgi:hypothetical protein
VGKVDAEVGVEVPSMLEACDMAAVGSWVKGDECEWERRIRVKVMDQLEVVLWGLVGCGSGCGGGCGGGLGDWRWKWWMLCQLTIESRLWIKT